MAILRYFYNNKTLHYQTAPQYSKKARLGAVCFGFVNNSCGFGYTRRYYFRDF